MLEFGYWEDYSYIRIILISGLLISGFQCTCLLGCFSTRPPPDDVGVIDCDLDAASDDVGRGCLGAGCFALRPRPRSPDDPAEGGVGGTKDGGRSLSPLQAIV